jgi:hypothetical protein
VGFPRKTESLCVLSPSLGNTPCASSSPLTTTKKDRLCVFLSSSSLRQTSYLCIFHLTLNERCALYVCFQLRPPYERRPVCVFCPTRNETYVLCMCFQTKVKLAPYSTFLGRIRYTTCVISKSAWVRCRI